MNNKINKNLESSRKVFKRQIDDIINLEFATYRSGVLTRLLDLFEILYFQEDDALDKLQLIVECSDSVGDLYRSLSSLISIQVNHEAKKPEVHEFA